MPPPQKPGWVPYQTQENCNSSNILKKTTSCYKWIGQCTIPADIVAYCKETFSQDIKLCITKPIIGLTVTGPPKQDRQELIPGVHIAQDVRRAMYPKYRCQSPYYNFDDNDIFDPTYDPKQWYKQLEKTSMLFGPQDPEILARQIAAEKRDMARLATEAAKAPMSSRPQVLVVRVNSLHVLAGNDIQRLVHAHPFQQAIVLYNFGQEPVIAGLKMAGIKVRREPISNAELGELINSLLWLDHNPEASDVQRSGLVPPRKYSDETLHRVANSPNKVLCECPRHVAELISQLASFEQYSQECLNKSAEDAHSFFNYMDIECHCSRDSSIFNAWKNCSICLSKTFLPNYNGYLKCLQQSIFTRHRQWCRKCCVPVNVV